MKERIEAWERRTGLPYDPPEELRALATPLARRATCPTLFRDPGPAGIRSYLEGRGRLLAPRAERWVWLADRPLGAGTRGAGRFGVVAILAPLWLRPCRTAARGHYLARNVRAAAGILTWVPPGLIGAAIPWDDIGDAAEARRALGGDSRQARRAVLADLGRYFEELGRLRASGAPDPGRPWCEVPGAKRRAVLAAWGVAPVWTAPRHP